MSKPSIADLKMWVGTLFTKDDWDFNFSQLVSWLADGSSDLVVNTLKTTGGLDLDGAQISNVGQATTGSQAINLDQANTLLNRSSYYYPFSVASGKVDSNGDAAYIQKVSDTEITVLAGNTNPDLVCVSSDGTIESVTSNVTLTVPVSDGTYHIIKEKGETVTITTGVSGKVSIGKVQPTAPNVGDYWLDNSVVPFVGRKYGLSGWEDVNFCYLGYVTVSSNTATVTIFPYNTKYPRYETAWADYAANTKYAFDLSNELISNVDTAHWVVEVWAKIKTTAVGGFSANSVFLLSSQNQYGGADQYDLGVGIIVENKVLTMWTGNTVSIRSGNSAAYNNVQLKIVIKAMEVN